MKAVPPFCRRLLLATCVAAVASLPDAAFAATSTNKRPGFRVSATTAFVTANSAGRALQCGSVKGRWVSGRMSRSLFYPNSYAVNDLQDKLKRSRNKSEQSKLKRQIASTTKSVKAADVYCVAGPDVLVERRGALSVAEVRYLYEKTAFGAVTPEAFTIGTTQGAGPLVDYLMTPRPDPALEADAAKYLDENYASDTTTVTARGVQLWSLHLMLRSSQPFYERLSFLFLHNVLATSMEVLTDETQRPLMVDHLNKIRTGALTGDYPALLKQITRDPVMLIWLNGNQNTKQQPNENFGRELLELFMLSPSTDRVMPDGTAENNYTEQTVAQVARACTGWTVQRIDAGNGQRVWSSVFGEAIHDPDPAKVIFEGQPWQGLVDNDVQVIDHVFKSHPYVATYIAKRITQEYLNEEPSPKVVASVAKSLKASNYNIKVALAKLLKSTEFWSEANKNSIVASPVERLVRFLRITGIPYDLPTIQRNIEGAGQMIGQPPTVFGWDNPAWPNGPWLLAYANTITQIVRNDSLFTRPDVNFSYTTMVPGGATDAALLAHLSGILGVTLTPNQQAAMVVYVNNRLQNNNMLLADAWDPANVAKVRRKVAGMLEVLTRTADFQMR